MRYDDDEKDLELIVSKDPIHQKAAVQFSNLKSPFLIESASVYINYTDMFPELPGNAYTPFIVSIYSDSAGFPHDPLTAPETTQVVDAMISDGEWVEVPVELLMINPDSFWVVMEWLEEFPSAPTIAVDYNSKANKSVIGYEGNGFDWDRWQNGDIMFRVKILQTDENGIYSVDDTAVFPDSVRIYSSGQPLIYPAEQFYETTVVGKMHARVVLPSLENYYCLTSFNTNLESESSDIVIITGSSGQNANIRFIPENINHTMPPENVSSVYFEIKNNEENELNYNILDINSEYLSLVTNPVLGLMPSEGVIQPDSSVQIRVDIQTAGVDPGAYLIELTFSFWDNDYGYQDEILEILLQVSELTSAEEYGNTVPEIFLLGQNYPNPFNSTTIIPFTIPNDEPAYLKIFNILGECVFKAEVSANQNQIEWNACDNKGNAVSSGIYFYKFTTDAINVSRKMTYLK